jgi:hypothetical protein
MVFSSFRFSTTSPAEGRLISVLSLPLGSLALSMSRLTSLELELFGIIGSVGERSAARFCTFAEFTGTLRLLLESLSCPPNRISLGRGLRGRPLHATGSQSALLKVSGAGSASH